MKRTLFILLAAGALAGLSGVAAAHGNVGFSVSIGVPVYAPPVYYPSAPPVYYSPPPVYYAPPPAVYLPPRVYYGPPRVLYGQPAYYYGRPRHGHHHRGHR